MNRSLLQPYQYTGRPLPCQFVALPPRSTPTRGGGREQCVGSASAQAQPNNRDGRREAGKAAEETTTSTDACVRSAAAAVVDSEATESGEFEFTGLSSGHYAISIETAAGKFYKHDGTIQIEDESLSELEVIPVAQR